MSASCLVTDADDLRVKCDEDVFVESERMGCKVFLSSADFTLNLFTLGIAK